MRRYVRGGASAGRGRRDTRNLNKKWKTVASGFNPHEPGQNTFQPMRVIHTDPYYLAVGTADIAPFIEQHFQRFYERYGPVYLFGAVAWPSDRKLWAAILKYVVGGVMIVNDEQSPDSARPRILPKKYKHFELMKRLPCDLWTLLDDHPDYDYLANMRLSTVQSDPPARMYTTGNPRGPFMHTKLLILMAMNDRRKIEARASFDGSYNMSGQAANSFERCTYSECAALADYNVADFTQILKSSRVLLI